MNNTPPKISVIIPAYNVERFIDKCLASICGQTFSDLEIIVVDDGSTDRTPTICDEWAERDPRIQVIHQPNGGISVARNTGLSHSTAPLIGFIDSDDFIEPNMYEQLYADLTAQEADIAVCNTIIDHKDGHSEYLFDHAQERIYENPEATYRLIMDQGFNNYLWCNLFRAELWQGIRFPQGRGYEDISIMHLIYAKARRIYFNEAALYHYVMHGNNYVLISNTRAELDYIKSKTERCRYVLSSDIFTASQKVRMSIYLCKNCIYPLKKVLCDKESSKYSEEIRAVQDFINQVLIIPIPRFGYNIRHIPRLFLELNQLIAKIGYH